MTLRALIFDVDATLAETEELHRRAFNECFQALDVRAAWPDPHRNWHWDRDTYSDLLRTTGGKERIAAYLHEWLGWAAADVAKVADKIRVIHGDKTRRYTELAAGGALTLRPGVAELVTAAREAGIRLAIATTTSRPNVDALVQACFGEPAEQRFEVIACGDEVTRKKPDPAVYLLALERLGLPAGSCIAIEDSLNGLRSAKAAGLYCLISASIYTRDEDHADADLRVTSFADLDLELLQRAVSGTAL